MKKVMALVIIVFSLLLISCGKKTFKVVFYVDETVYKEESVKKGELVNEADEPKKEGYTFKGWSKSKTDFQKYNFKSGVSESFNLYAFYDVIRLKVIFYNGDNKHFEKDIEYGKIVEKPEVPEREGYTFKGWSIKKDEYLEYDFKNQLKTEINLYAFFEINQLKVIFYDGENKYRENGYKYGDLVIEPEKPSKEGYIFKGWSKSKTDYQEFNFKSGIDNNITLYAFYDQKDIGYEFYVNDELYDEKVFKYSEKIIVPDNPVIKHMDFRGWSTDNNEFKVFDVNGNYPNDVKLYAFFKEHPYGINLYDSDKLIQTLTVTKSKNVLPSPTKEGYTFKGWSIKKDEYTEFDLELIVEQVTNLYAFYDRTKYQVTYYDNENEITKEEYNYGDVLTLIDGTEKDGFYFLGWSLRKDKYEKITETKIINNHINIYAFYEDLENLYVVTYNTGDSETSYDELFTKGTIPRKPALVTKDTKYIAYWMNGDIRFDFNKVQNSNLILDAVWDEMREIEFTYHRVIPLSIEEIKYPFVIEAETNDIYTIKVNEYSDEEYDRYVLNKTPYNLADGYFVEASYGSESSTNYVFIKESVDKQELYYKKSDTSFEVVTINTVNKINYFNWIGRVIHVYANDYSELYANSPKKDDITFINYSNDLGLNSGNKIIRSEILGNLWIETTNGRFFDMDVLGTSNITPRFSQEVPELIKDIYNPNVKFAVQWEDYLIYENQNELYTISDIMNPTIDELDLKLASNEFVIAIKSNVISTNLNKHYYLLKWGNILALKVDLGNDKFDSFTVVNGGNYFYTTNNNFYSLEWTYDENNNLGIKTELANNVVDKTITYENIKQATLGSLILLNNGVLVTNTLENIFTYNYEYKSKIYLEAFEKFIDNPDHILPFIGWHSGDGFVYTKEDIYGNVDLYPFFGYSIYTEFLDRNDNVEKRTYNIKYIMSVGEFISRFEYIDGYDIYAYTDEARTKRLSKDTMINMNQKIYLKYVVKSEYNVTISDAFVEKEVEYRNDGTIVLPKPRLENEDVHFIGWFDENGNEFDDTMQVTRDLFLIAKYQSRFEVYLNDDVEPIEITLEYANFRSIQTSLSEKLWYDYQLEFVDAYNENGIKLENIDALTKVIYARAIDQEKQIIIRFIPESGLAENIIIDKSNPHIREDQFPENAYGFSGWKYSDEKNITRLLTTETKIENYLTITEAKIINVNLVINDEVETVKAAYGENYYKNEIGWFLTDYLNSKYPDQEYYLEMFSDSEYRTEFTIDIINLDDEEVTIYLQLYDKENYFRLVIDNLGYDIKLFIEKNNPYLNIDMVKPFVDNQYEVIGFFDQWKNKEINATDEINEDSYILIIVGKWYSISVNGKAYEVVLNVKGDNQRDEIIKYLNGQGIEVIELYTDSAHNNILGYYEIEPMFIFAKSYNKNTEYLVTIKLNSQITYLFVSKDNPIVTELPEYNNEIYYLKEWTVGGESISLPYTINDNVTIVATIVREITYVLPFREEEKTLEIEITYDTESIIRNYETDYYIEGYYEDANFEQKISHLSGYKNVVYLKGYNRSEDIRLNVYFEDEETTLFFKSGSKIELGVPELTHYYDHFVGWKNHYTEEELFDFSSITNGSNIYLFGVIRRNVNIYIGEEQTFYNYDIEFSKMPDLYNEVAEIVKHYTDDYFPILYDKYGFEINRNNDGMIDITDFYYK